MLRRGGPSVYLAAIAGTILLVAGGFVLRGEKRDHLSAIAPDGDSAWYQDLGGDAVTEIQDQDLFFHDIGRSITYARKADIIMLGSSLVAFGVDSDVIRERIEKKYGLKFYNMSFVGIASGEFSREIIEKYDLHPRLWVINADDGGGGGNFFTPSIVRAFGGDVKTIAAVNDGWAGAYANVVRRDFRWRLEALGADARAVGLTGAPIRTVIAKFYRNDETGEADMRFFPRYFADDNPRVRMTRDPDCHTTSDMIALARRYVEDLGSQIVLTQVPNMYGCMTQATEIAKAIGADLALPANTDDSSWDGGGHLDHQGAMQFTNDFVDALERTKVFQQLIEK